MIGGINVLILYISVKKFVKIINLIKKNKYKFNEYFFINMNLIIKLKIIN